MGMSTKWKVSSYIWRTYEFQTYPQREDPQGRSQKKNYGWGDVHGQILFLSIQHYFTYLLPKNINWSKCLDFLPAGYSPDLHLWGTLYIYNFRLWVFTYIGEQVWHSRLPPM